MIAGVHTATENVSLIPWWTSVAHGDIGIPALRNYPKQIRSLNEARSISGVGEKTALKVCFPTPLKAACFSLVVDRLWKSLIRETSSVSRTRIRKMSHLPGLSKAFMALASTHCFSLLVDNAHHTLRPSYCLCLVCKWTQNAG